MMRHRMMLLVCGSLAIAAWPISTSSQELTPLEIGVLAAAFALVLAAQCAVLWLVGRVAGRYADVAADVVLVTFAVLNAYYFAFITLEGHWLTAAALATVAGLGAGFLQRARVPREPVMVFTAIFVSLSASQYSYGRILPEVVQSVTATRGHLPVNSRTNVYLISIESLHSPYAFRLLYGIADAPHVAYLKQEGFRVFDRGYSADTDTRSSFQRLLEYSKLLTGRREMMSAFRLGNATFDSFKQSGYGVQFIYVSNYLNVNHNLLDHGYPADGFYICEHLRRAFYYFICKPPVRTFISSSLFHTPGVVSADEEVAHLQERIRVVAADSRPWLTISHIDHPRHTGPEHRHDVASDVAQFRAETIRWTPPIADRYRQIVSTIKTLDPHAIIVTFGDHGKWLTRGMSSAEPNKLFSAEDFIEDRYGVMIGVYPADFCRNRIFEGSSTTFIVKSVIQCLNGDDAPTDEERERSRSVVYQGELTTIEGILARSANTN